MNFKKRVITISSILFVCLAFTSRVLALPSPSATAGTDEVINLIHQEVQKRTSTIQAEPKNIGVVGTVSGISASGDLAKIATARQGEKSASISGQTTIFRVDASGIRKQVKANDIKTGDNIIVMGQTNDSGLVTAKRIILYVPDNLKRLVYLGKVTAKSLNKLSIETVKTKNNVDFALTTNSDFNQFVASSGSNSGKLVDLKLANLNQGDVIIIAGAQADNKTAEATIIVKLSSASPLPSPTVKGN